MEGVQECGTKRSGGEAALPERAADGQQSPGALLVDACGVPVASGAKGGSDGVQQSQVDGEVECDGAVIRPSEQPAVEQQLAEPMEVEPTRGGEGSASTEKETEPSTTGNGGRYAKAEKNVDDSEKEGSRKSFASLVKATCSQRSYPY